MNRLKKFLAAVRDDLSQGENLDAYVLFVAGVSFAVLGIFGVVNQNILGAVILAALSLLVVGDVINRHNSRELRQIVTEKQSASISCPLKTFTVLEESVAQRVSLAQSILLLGISLHRSIPVQRDRISRALTAGGRLRILVVNPDNGLVKVQLHSLQCLSSPTIRGHILLQALSLDFAR